MALLVLLNVAAAVASQQPDEQVCAAMPRCLQANETLHELAKTQQNLITESQDIDAKVASLKNLMSLPQSLRLTESQRGRAFNALASLLQTATLGAKMNKENEERAAVVSADSEKGRRCDNWPMQFEEYVATFGQDKGSLYARLMDSRSYNNEETDKLYWGQKYDLYMACLWRWFAGLHWWKMKVDLRTEMTRIGESVESTQKEVMNGLSSFLTGVKLNFKAAMNGRMQDVNDKLVDLEQLAAQVDEQVDMFNGYVRDAEDDVLMNKENYQAYARDSGLNQMLLVKQYNNTAGPLDILIRSQIDAIRNGMKSFMAIRKKKLEEALAMSDKELGVLHKDSLEMRKDEKLALEEEDQRENKRKLFLQDKWKMTQGEMDHLLSRAARTYERISAKAEDQLRRVHKRGVWRMKEFEKLSTELDEVAQTAFAAVKDTLQNGVLLVKEQYRKSFAMDNGGIENIENEVTRLWRRYSKKLKESYQEIDAAGGRVAAKQLVVGKSVADANYKLLAIQQEYREEKVALDTFLNVTLDQLKLDAENANETNKLAADANITRAIELDAGRQLRKVRDDTRARLATMSSDVTKKNELIKKKAHDLTQTVEANVDDANAALKSLERRDLSTVQGILQDMEHRLERGYQTRYADDDELIGKVKAQDNELYNALHKHEDESFAAVDALTAEDGGLPSLKNDMKTAVAMVHRGAHDATDELRMYKRFFEQDLQLHQKRLDHEQMEFAKDAFKRTYQAEKAASQTGTVINALLPAVKDVVVSAATEEMKKISNMQDHLRDQSKQVVLGAAASQADVEQNMVGDSAQFGDGLAKSLRGELEGHDSSLATLQQDLQSTSDELLSRQNEAGTVSAQAADEVKLVQKAIEENMNGVAEKLKATRDTAKKVVDHDRKAQLEAQQKALQSIKTKLFSDKSRAQQQIQIYQQSETQELAKLEQTSSHETAGMKKEAHGNVKGIQAQYIEKLGTAQSAFKALMAHIKGLATDTDEWRDMVEDAIKGERAAAHRQAVVEAKTRLEQQAMIDSRYRELTATVQMRVDGLSNSTQEQTLAYVRESKKAAQKILNSVSMSDGEKLKALEKVDNWLVDQLQTVEAVAKQAESEAGSHGDASVEFAEQARRKANELQHALDADKSIHQVFADQDVSTEEMSLEGLIQDADAKATSIFSSTQAHVSNFAGAHEADAARLKHRCATDLQVALQAMTSAVGLKEAAKKALAASERKREHLLGAEEQDLQSFVATTEGTSSGMAGRLGTQTAEREKRFDFLKDWTVGFQTTSAESIEELTRIMYQLVQNDKVYFEQNSEKISEFASHLADVLNSDEVKTLSKIGHVDRGADDMIKADEKLLSETEDYDRATARYRQKVATSLDHLTGGLTGELAKLSTRATEFDYGLKKDADAWQSKSEDELRDVLKGQEKAVQTEEHRMQHELDNLRTEFATQMEDDAEDQHETVANAKQQADEHLEEEKHFHDEFADLMGSVTEGGVVEEYARTLTQLLHAKQEELDQARARLDVRMTGLSKLVAVGAQTDPTESSPTSAIQIHSGDRRSERQRRARGRLEHAREQEEQGENARLVEEHSKLVEKAKRLALEVRRIQA